MKKTLLVLFAILMADLALANVITTPPEIWHEVTNDAVIIGVNGEGEIHLYFEGEEVECPVWIERRDEDMWIHVNATAQEDGLEMSSSEAEILIPALIATDPHMNGYWIVLLDRNRNEIWQELVYNGYNGYNNIIVLNYSTYGGYNPETQPPREVPFYYVIDGIKYGAEFYYQEALLGNPVMNPLIEYSDNYYTIPVGYNYVFGIVIDDYGAKYANIVAGAYTGGDPTDYIDDNYNLPGDLNGDGLFDVSDVTALIGNVLNDGDVNMTVADLNGDGIIDVADVTALIRIILNSK